MMHVAEVVLLQPFGLLQLLDPTTKIKQLHEKLPDPAIILDRCLAFCEEVSRTRSASRWGSSQ